MATNLKTTATEDIRVKLWFETKMEILNSVASVSVPYVILERATLVTQLHVSMMVPDIWPAVLTHSGRAVHRYWRWAG